MTAEKKFFVVEIHESDGNDNWISEGFFAAKGREEAVSAAYDLLRKKLGDRIWDLQGDDCVIPAMYHVENQCDNGEDCENERCSKDHRTHSVTIYFDQDDEGLSEEPEGSSSPWHPWNGNLEEM